MEIRSLVLNRLSLRYLLGIQVKNVKLAAGVGGNVQAEDRIVEFNNVQWCQSHEAIEINWRVRVAIRDETLKSEPWGSVLLKLN